MKFKIEGELYIDEDMTSEKFIYAFMRALGTENINYSGTVTEVNNEEKIHN